MASTMTSSYSAPRTSAAQALADNTISLSTARSDSTKGLSAMLLTAMVSALLVVADQLIDTWADGHLLAAWVALWAVGFAALAVFGGAARKVAATVVVALDGWSQRVAQSRADERLWAIAQSDPRVMAELQMAIQRGEDEVRTPIEASRWNRFAARFGVFLASSGREAPRQRNCMYYL